MYVLTICCYYEFARERKLISDTVKTHIKEHVLWGFRLMLFLYIGQR